MICSYCGQGEILRAEVKKTGELILICDEYDTVWENNDISGGGISFAQFMENQFLLPYWSEIEILEQMPENFQSTADRRKKRQGGIYQ